MTATVDTFENINDFIRSINQYNTFRVQSNNPREYPSQVMQCESFISTTSGSIAAQRTFAYQAIFQQFKSAVKNVLNGRTIYLVSMGGRNKDILTIEAKNKNKNVCPCAIEQFKNGALFEDEYIDYERSYYDSINESYIFVIDVDSIGEFNHEQKNQFKELIDLDQWNSRNDIAKTVYFEVKNRNDKTYVTAVGIYDLDDEQIVFHKKIESNETLNRKASMVLEHVKKPNCSYSENVPVKKLVA